VPVLSAPISGLTATTANTDQMLPFPLAAGPAGCALSFPNLVGGFNGCDMIGVPTCFPFRAFPPRRVAAKWAGQPRNPLSRGTPGLNSAGAVPKAERASSHLQHAGLTHFSCRTNGSSSIERLSFETDPDRLIIFRSKCDVSEASLQSPTGSL